MIGIVVVAIMAVALAANRVQRVSTAGMVIDRGSFRWNATAALARTEGLRILRGPGVLLAAGLAGYLMLVGMGEGSIRGGLSGLAVLPLTLVAGAIAALAASRDRGAIVELAASLPVSGRSRVPAHLLAGLPLALAVTAAIGLFAVLRLGTDLSTPIDVGGVLDGVWHATALELIQGPLMILMAMSVATGAAVWFRHPLPGMLVVVWFFFTPVMWELPPFIEGGLNVHWGTDVPYTVTQATVGVHVLYQTAFIATASILALLKHDRRARVWIGLALALSVTEVAVSIRDGMLP